MLTQKKKNKVRINEYGRRKRRKSPHTGYQNYILDLNFIELSMSYKNYTKHKWKAYHHLLTKRLLENTKLVLSWQLNAIYAYERTCAKKILEFNQRRVKSSILNSTLFTPSNKFHSILIEFNKLHRMRRHSIAYNDVHNIYPSQTYNHTHRHDTN